MQKRTKNLSAALALAIAASVGCAGQQNVDPTDARAAVYNTEFASLFQEVALAVKGEYPNLAAKPNEKVVKTAWHQLPLSETVETQEAPTNKSTTHISGQDGRADKFDERRAFRRDATRREMKHFVRFDVKVEPTGAPGSNQWKIVVTGQASAHDGTGMPTELKGAERPYWLDGRIAKLEVKVYERVKRMSVASR